MPIGRVLSLVIDCHDPSGLAEFWSQLVGGDVDARNESEEWVALRNVPQLGYLAFQKVPEPKTFKNRLHLDIDVADMEACVGEAVSIGAEVVGHIVEEPTNFFQVMRDPEGNEFCFILRK